MLENWVKISFLVILLQAARALLPLGFEVRPQRVPQLSGPRGEKRLLTKSPSQGGQTGLKVTLAKF